MGKVFRCCALLTSMFIVGMSWTAFAEQDTSSGYSDGESAEYLRQLEAEYLNSLEYLQLSPEARFSIDSQLARIFGSEKREFLHHQMMTNSRLANKIPTKRVISDGVTFGQIKASIVDQNLKTCLEERVDDSRLIEDVRVVVCTKEPIETLTGLHVFNNLYYVALALAESMKWKDDIFFQSVTSVALHENAPDDEFLTRFPNIERLYFKDVDLRDAELRNSPDSLKNVTFYKGTEFNDLAKLLREVKNLDELTFTYPHRPNPAPCFSDDALLSIQSLAYISRLFIAGCELTNLNGLENLTSLTSLSVIKTNLENVSSVSGLKDLSWLNLSYNRLGDESHQYIAKLVGLDVLLLEGNSFRDYSFLSVFENLTYLTIGGGGIEISSLDFLSAMPRLETLAFIDGYFSSHEITQSIPNVTNLIFRDFLVDSFEQLNVENLGSFYYQISDTHDAYKIDLPQINLSGLGNSESLWDVSLQASNLYNLDGLRTSKNITRVSIYDSPITDISGLENSKDINLVINGNQDLKCFSNDSGSLSYFSYEDLIPCFSTGDFDGDGIVNGEDNDIDDDGMDNEFEKLHLLNNYFDDTFRDPDSDALNNMAEYQNNTDPNNPDTDSDGLSDGTEVQFGLNPLSADDASLDLDGDGLNNLEEAGLGTELNNVDSDSDQMPDGYEVTNNLDPLDSADAESDTDGDALTALEEYQNNTNPSNADTDEDGINDGIEVALELNPNDAADAALDLDGDGLTNLEEVGLGTELNNADSDSDQMPDGYEVSNNLDPLDAADAESDTDGDALTALEEYQNNTNPSSADTDEDGINDGIEVTLELNPNDAGDAALDLDGDGLTNLEEVGLGTELNNADSDSDQMPDGYEVSNNLDPLDAADAASDTDSDALTAVAEYQAGTDPDNDDSDNDNIPDGYEVSNRLNPLDRSDASLDMDGDGLSNFGEYWFGTLVNNPDSDGDLLPDGYELSNDFDPLDSTDASEDADADSLTNYDEYVFGTDPHDADSDGDGIADGAEVSLGLNPLQADAQSDVDGDGISNFDEYLAGTDPLDATSFYVPDDYYDFEDGQLSSEWSTDGATGWLTGDSGYESGMSLRSGAADVSSVSLSGLSGATGIRFRVHTGGLSEDDELVFWVDGREVYRWDDVDEEWRLFTYRDIGEFEQVSWSLSKLLGSDEQHERYVSIDNVLVLNPRPVDGDPQSVASGDVAASEDSRNTYAFLGFEAEEEAINWPQSGTGSWSETATDAWQGVFSLSPGVIEDNELAELTLEGEFFEGELRFMHKVRSEENADVFEFVVNDDVFSFSGARDWEAFSYPLTAGQHTLKWRYQKDASDSAIEDSVWIDNIELPLQRVMSTHDAVTFDYDGDRMADVAVRRPATFYQYIKRSEDTGISRRVFGKSSGDIPVAGDFDGDGMSDLAVYRPSNGFFYTVNSSDDSIGRIDFGGGVEDIPLPADYDGDGVTDFALWQASSQLWRIHNSTGEAITVVNAGVPLQHIAVPADYDGDGKTDIAYRDPDNSSWHILYSESQWVGTVTFGRQSADIPVQGDFDGDGKADIAVRRPGNFTWYVRNSSGTTFNSSYGDHIQRVVFGRDALDMPIAADYDGDGITDFAVRRAGNFTQYILNSSDNAIQRIEFGKNENDIPLAAPISVKMDMLNP